MKYYMVELCNWDEIKYKRSYQRFKSIDEARQMIKMIKMIKLIKSIGSRQAWRIVEVIEGIVESDSTT